MTFHATATNNPTGNHIGLLFVSRQTTQMSLPEKSGLHLAPQTSWDLQLRTLICPKPILSFV